MYNNIGLEHDWTYRVKLCSGNLGKWNSVKWNETHRIGASFACFYVARVWRRQLGFLVLLISVAVFVLLASACLSYVLVMKLFIWLKLWNPVTSNEYITGYSCLASFSPAVSVIVSDSGDIVLVDVRSSHINWRRVCVEDWMSVVSSALLLTSLWLYAAVSDFEWSKGLYYNNSDFPLLSDTDSSRSRPLGIFW